MPEEYNANKTGFSLLFSPLTLGAFQMKNRLVALPVHTGFSHADGRVSSWMIDSYSRLAKTGVGLVIVANAAVSSDGVVSTYNLRVDRDEYIQGLAELASAIKNNGALSCIQLNHAGRFAKTERPLLPSPIIRGNLSFNIESLKEFMDFFPFEKRFGLTRYLFNQVKTWGRAMSQEDRERVIHDFAAAALRACEAGFDMVELHGANGYLICQYLSPFTNKSESGYGGDFKARTGFPLAVIRKIKEKLPKGFPIGFRLLVKEWVPGGIEADESLSFARCLENEGIVYLSASAGTYNSIFSPKIMKEMAHPAYLEKEVKTLTSQVRLPTIIAGRITTPASAEQLVRDGVADLIGLGRPLKVDPEWVSKAMNPGKKIKTCVNCNWCLKHVVLEKGFKCSLWPRWVQMKTELEHRFLIRETKPLWVIAGPDDMLAFNKTLPCLIRPGAKKAYPVVLFLESPNSAPVSSRIRNDFVEWVQSTLDMMNLSGRLEYSTVFESRENWEKAVLNVVQKCNPDQVFIGKDTGQSWRERLLYKIRGRTLTLLNPNSHLRNVLVAIDFSPATLLTMRFLNQNYMAGKDFKFTFIHAQTDSSKHKEHRWKEFKKITGIDPEVPLRLISSSGDVAYDLTRIVRKENFGTVVMGKRGISGIKRWFLGSVSASVLKHLTDQTICLID